MEDIMKAVGFTCGIGSMLVGARQEGFEIIGNIEWRPYYHYSDLQGNNTFVKNFPSSLFYSSKKDLLKDEEEAFKNVELAMGHPECGNYSNLVATSQTAEGLAKKRKDPGDIPIFVDLVKTFQPEFFVQDNLPGSLLGYSIEKWAKNLPEYDLFPEWVSNWGYGNAQKFRNRFFMIGAKKKYKYVFVPKEIEHEKTLRSVLEGLPPVNNDKHTINGRTSHGIGVYHDDYMTLAEYHKFWRESEEGTTIPYKASDGTWKKHIAHRKAFKDRYIPVITGNTPVVNPFTCFPFNVRERCRIQGLPDDFIIYGTKLNHEGEWNFFRNLPVIRQTGKCMPVEFCRYISGQIKQHLNGDLSYREFPSRVIKDNQHISAAKSWYCENVGYPDQKLACSFCGVTKCNLVGVK